MLEVIFESKQVDQLGVPSTSVEDALEEGLGIFDKLFYGLDRGEDAMLFLELVDTEGGLSWDQEAVFLYQGPNAISQEVEWGLEEVWGGLGEQSDDSLVLVDLDLVMIDFLVFGLAGNFMGFLEEVGGESQVEFGPEGLEEGEELDSDVAVVLFFEELEVGLRDGSKFGIDLLLGG